MPSSSSFRAKSSALRRWSKAAATNRTSHYAKRRWRENRPRPDSSGDRMSQNEVDFFETIRGVEVKVVARNFTEDASVGIGLGPDEVYANVLNEDGTVGEIFELTDAESEAL